MWPILRPYTSKKSFLSIFFSLFFSIILTKNIKAIENTHYTVTSIYVENEQENISAETISTLTTIAENETEVRTLKPSRIKKDWTFITYMAADNDLAPFARKNLRQQADIGSNRHVNIVTQLDTRVAGNKKVTKRYYIEKDKLIVTNQNDPNTQKMDSGLPATLIDCCKWAITNFPANNYALVLWDHGTGALDVIRHRNVNPLPLFLFNPNSNLLELDRSIPFIDFVQATCCSEHRAICFDDSTGHALNNQDLEYALDTICSKFLGGKKFSIISFDACLMSMIEIANIVKKYSLFMTASQEVELGTGYDYFKILRPFYTQTFTPEEFAKHIVKAYQIAYSSITNDYTQSTLKLSDISILENTIDRIASLLIDALKIQKNYTVREAIKISRHKLYCTHFDEPSYLDWHHFCSNLLVNCKKFEFNNQQQGKKICSALEVALTESLAIVKNIVIANAAGKNLNKAQGISIYFPERRLHQSYQKTKFAQTNKWFTFIKCYLTT